MDASSKKAKRIESKKRKAKAFLELIKESQQLKKEKEDSEDGSDSAAKVQKLSSDNGNTSKGGTQVTLVEGNVASKPNEKLSFKSEDELAEMRRIMRERQKASMEKPKLYLLLDELQFQHSRQMSEDLTYKELPPLFMLDLQHLLLYAAQGNISSHKPRWCRLLRVGKITSVVVIVLDSVSSYEYQMYADCFPRLKQEFDMSVDMVSPEQYGSTVHEDLFKVPLSNASLLKINGGLSKETRKLISEALKPPGYSVSSKPKNSQPKEKQDDAINRPSAQDKSPKEAINKPSTQDKSSKEAINKPSTQDKSLIEGFPNTSVLHKNDTFERTSLLLNSTQMIAEDFPMPINYGNSDSYKNFVFTKDSYSTVHNQSPLYAVDCEMCITSAKKYELTRVSVVNEDLETVYDSYVKPYNKIIDYVTRYSGITKTILDPVKTRLGDVQKFLQKVLPPDAILCGQSLKGDLIALQMFHPYVIDTSVIFNLSGQRVFKTSLKKLAAHFLGKTIQDSTEGHSSVEDSITTMELVKLKLKQSPNFGDIVNGGELFPKEGTSKNETGETSKDNPSISDNNNSSQSDNRSINDSGDKIISNTNIGSGDMTVDTDCSCMEPDKGQCKYCENKRRQQRKSFFSKAGSQVYDSFFHLMQKQKKVVGLIDKAETIGLYKDDSVTAVPTMSDRDSKSTGKSLVQFHDFVYMNFPSYHEVFQSDTEEEKMCILSKQDKRMSKVLKHVRPNSLVAIVMSGRCHGNQNYSAKTFVKIT